MGYWLRKYFEDPLNWSNNRLHFAFGEFIVKALQAGLKSSWGQMWPPGLSLLTSVWKHPGQNVWSWPWKMSDIYLFLHLRSSSWPERWISTFMKGNSMRVRVSQEIYPVTAEGFVTFSVLENAVLPRPEPTVARKCSSMNWKKPHTGDFPVCVTAGGKKKKGMINHRVVRGPVFNLGSEQKEGKRRGMNQISRRGRRGEEQKPSLVF